jgi:hypothetical protein
MVVVVNHPRLWLHFPLHRNRNDRFNILRIKSDPIKFYRTQPRHRTLYHNNSSSRCSCNATVTQAHRSFLAKHRHRYIASSIGTISMIHDTTCSSTSTFSTHTLPIPIVVEKEQQQQQPPPQSMGLFRLLNDAQRAILVEQRQLTHDVVRQHQ